MIEISNQIIEADDLLNKVRRNILNKNIDVKQDAFLSRRQDYPAFSADNQKVQNLLLEYRRDIYRASDLRKITDPEIKSFKRRFKGMRVLVKKLIKKLTFWIIKPYWEQQNLYNDAVIEALKRIDEINKTLVSSAEQR